MKQFIIIGLLVVIAQSSMAQQERKYIRKGTSEYGNQKFVESEIEYRKALDKDPRSYEAQFNMADALYKQQKLNEALEQFQALAGTQTDKQRLSHIYHNIGNIYFSAGKFDESINAYKSALKNNPLDDETRYNLIAAQKKKQEQQKDQDKQQQQQQQQDQQKQDQQQKEQEQKQDKNNQQQQQSQMNKQDAERLLNAMQQDEDDLQKEKRKVKAAQKATIEKNW